MRRAFRIVRVTLGLAAAGAVAGVAVAWLALLGLTLATIGPANGRLMWEAAQVLLAGATRQGAMLGAVVGPTVAWALMRRVPLWAAVGGTALGALAGGAAGVVVGGGGFRWLWAALAGVLVTAVLLHGYFRNATRHASGVRSIPDALPWPEALSADAVARQARSVAHDPR